MIKVGFLKELKSGELIVLPGGGCAPLRLSMAKLGQFAEVSQPARKPDKLLRMLTAARKRRGKS